MNSNTTRENPDELKKEVLHQVNKVDAEIDHLEDQLTPGQIIDGAIFRKKATFAENLNHLKANPIGTTLLTVGTILLMEDENGETYERVSSKSSERLRIKATGKISRSSESLKEKVDGASRTVNYSLRKVKSSAEDLLHAAEGKIDQIKNSAGSKIQTTSENLPSYDKAKESLSTEGIDLLQKSEGFIKEKSQSMGPFGILALGAGLGVLTGAAVPLSDKEKEISQNYDADLRAFQSEIKDALSRSMDALKDKALGDLKNFSFAAK